MQIRFDDNLKASDLTPEDVRLALNLPMVVEEQVVFGHSGDWTKSNKHKALVNPEDGTLFGVVSDHYRLVRHEEAILDIMSSISEVDTGPVEWTASGSRGFRRVHLQAKFTDRPAEVKVGDIIFPVVGYLNSYDGTWGERLWLETFRLVCFNGAVVSAGKQVRLSAAHLGHERPADMLPALEDSFHQFQHQVDQYRGWVGRPLQIAHVENALNVLDMTKKDQVWVLEEIDREPEMDLYGFYNVVTSAITHRVQSLDRRVQSWRRLREVQGTWDQ